MWTTPQPMVSALHSYETCTRSVRDESLKERFATAKKDAEEAAATYIRAGESATLDYLNAADFTLPGLTTREMCELYDRRMAAKNSSGREIYDAIKVSSRGGKCPICGHREVMTLDHYLPKSHFPALAVAPINLIPACSDCNWIKSSSREPVLHPYYDNIENDQWLAAEVIELAPAAVRYFVQCPLGWPQSLTDRVISHFRTFKLGVLYTSQAARMLSGNRQMIVGLYSTGGAQAVRNFLCTLEQSWMSIDQNCWEAALFSALAASDWFCDGGFRL